MKKTLLIVSHIGSDSNKFCQILNQHSRIEIKNLFLSYSSPETLLDLHYQPHKLNNTSAIYGDQIIFNKDFSSVALYELCKFVFFIKEPISSLKFLTEELNYNELTAFRYYSFRLKRIYEMCLKVPAVLLTEQNIRDKKGLNLIEEYLNLNEPIPYVDLPEEKKDLVSIDPNISKLSYDCYEKYLYNLKQIPSLKSID